MQQSTWTFALCLNMHILERRLQEDKVQCFSDLSELRLKDCIKKTLKMWKPLSTLAKCVNVRFVNLTFVKRRTLGLWLERIAWSGERFKLWGVTHFGGSPAWTPLAFCSNPHSKPSWFLETWLGVASPAAASAIPGSACWRGLIGHSCHRAQPAEMPDISRTQRPGSREQRGPRAVGLATAASIGLLAFWALLFSAQSPQQREDIVLVRDKTKCLLSELLYLPLTGELRVFNWHEKPRDEAYFAETSKFCPMNNVIRATASYSSSASRGVRRLGAIVILPWDVFRQMENECALSDG